MATIVLVMVVFLFDREFSHIQNTQLVTMNRVTSALLLIISVVHENQISKTFGYTTAIINNVICSYWALQF